METTDTISINASPSKVYDTIIFFFKSSENYRVWHKDHVSCYWKKGNDFSPGSVLVAEEYLHGRLHKMGFKIVSNEPGRSIDYKMQFPFSLICSGGSFTMRHKGEETELVAGLKFRGGLLLKKLFKKETEAVKIHMKEEGIAVKEIVEKTR